MTEDQQELSARQFGSSAARYLSSPVHATGADLDRLVRLTRDLRPARALDLGCGAGHVSFALARGGAGRVTACDPSASMLEVVAREATARGHGAVETRIASAETLPFERGCFDLVVTRFSAHHWRSVPQALAECVRTLAPGGRLVVIDAIAPEAPLLDTCLQTLEFLRDASHVRDYRVSEWVAMQQAAGFAEPEVATWKLPMEFQSWVARIGTPTDRIAALRAALAALPHEAREYFRVGADLSGADLSFVIDAAWIETWKPG